MEQTKPTWVRSNRLNVNGRRLRRLAVSRQSKVLHCTHFLFLRIFSPLSLSSRHPSHWLRAQNAASALCCWPRQRLGVGKGWHGQRDAGEVRFPPPTTSRVHRAGCIYQDLPGSQLIGIKVRVAHVLLHVYTRIECCPLSAVCRDWPLTPD